jgi:hypothetical protein
MPTDQWFALAGLLPETRVEILFLPVDEVGPRVGARRHV